MKLNNESNFITEPKNIGYLYKLYGILQTFCPFEQICVKANVHKWPTWIKSTKKSKKLSKTIL